MLQNANRINKRAYIPNSWTRKHAFSKQISIALPMFCQLLLSSPTNQHQLTGISLRSQGESVLYKSWYPTLLNLMVLISVRTFSVVLCCNVPVFKRPIQSTTYMRQRANYLENHPKAHFYTTEGHKMIVENCFLRLLTTETLCALSIWLQ